MNATECRAGLPGRDAGESRQAGAPPAPRRRVPFAAQGMRRRRASPHVRVSNARQIDGGDHAFRIASCKSVSVAYRRCIACRRAGRSALHRAGAELQGDGCPLGEEPVRQVLCQFRHRHRHRYRLGEQRVFHPALAYGMLRTFGVDASSPSKRLVAARGTAGSERGRRRRGGTCCVIFPEDPGGDPGAHRARRDRADGRTLSWSFAAGNIAGCCSSPPTPWWKSRLAHRPCAGRARRVPGSNACRRLAGWERAAIRRLCAFNDAGSLRDAE